MPIVSKSKAFNSVTIIIKKWNVYTSNYNKFDLIANEIKSEENIFQLNVCHCKIDYKLSVKLINTYKSIKKKKKTEK